MASRTEQCVQRVCSAFKIRAVPLAILLGVIFVSEMAVPVFLPWLWSTRDIQHIFTTLPSCQNRVAASQHGLFTPHVYLSRYNFSLVETGEHMSWVDEMKEENAALCKQGFSGNPGLYGLGIRLGLYLHWAALLLANHLLFETPPKLLQTSLFINVALMAALLKMSVQDSCNFSIEVMIVHLMLIFGFFIMFCRPNVFRATAPKLSNNMPWTRVIEHTLEGSIIGHVAWFWLMSYNWHFMTMPYETVYFVFGPVGDDYICNRRLMYQLWAGGALGCYLFKTVLFVVPYLKDVAGSKSYQVLLWTLYYMSFNQLQIDQLVDSSSDDGMPAHKRHKKDLPTSTNSLSTQQPVQDRGNRVIWAVSSSAMGCGSFVYAIIAIECIIRWNIISDVDSLDSIGQYAPLIVGLGMFMTVLREIAKNKKKPVIDARKHHQYPEDVERKQNLAIPSHHQ